MHEGAFTTREFYERYVACAWNEPLAEGLALANSGDFQGARPSLEAGLARTPDSAAGHGAMAYVLTRLGRTDEAIAAADRALEIEPGHAAYYAQLGGPLRSRGDSQRVESALRTAFELDPCEPNFAGLLANFLRERNRLDEGISVARQGLECSPYAENLHLELGHLLARAGDITGAEQAFRRAH